MLEHVPVSNIGLVRSPGTTGGALTEVRRIYSLYDTGTLRAKARKSTSIAEVRDAALSGKMANGSDNPHDMFGAEVHFDKDLVDRLIQQHHTCGRMVRRSCFSPSKRRTGR